MIILNGGGDTVVCLFFFLFFLNKNLSGTCRVCFLKYAFYASIEKLLTYASTKMCHGIFVVNSYWPTMWVKCDIL